MKSLINFIENTCPDQITKFILQVPAYHFLLKYQSGKEFLVLNIILHDKQTESQL